MNLPRRQPSIEANDILARISEVELFRYYISNFSELGKAFCSELRRDQHASAIVKMTKGGYIRYMDFADDSANGDIFTYLSHAFLMSYDEVLTKVARDFGITEGGSKTETIKKKLGEGVIKQKEYSFIQVGAKPFTKADKEYWRQYKLSVEDLKLEDVQIYSIKQAFLNRKKLSIGKNELAFCYLYQDKYMKLYFPEREKSKKWISNVPLNMMYGLDSLKDNKNILITKSVKDLLILRKFITSFSAGTQNESNSSISLENISILKNMKKVYLLFDNDEKGVSACSHYNQYGFDYWNIPKKYPEKDLADFVRSYGEELLKKEISKKINLDNI